MMPWPRGVAGARATFRAQSQSGPILSPGRPRRACRSVLGMKRRCHGTVRRSFSTAAQIRKSPQASQIRKCPRASETFSIRIPAHAFSSGEEEPVARIQRLIHRGPWNKRAPFVLPRTMRAALHVRPRSSWRYSLYTGLARDLVRQTEGTIGRFAALRVDLCQLQEIGLRTTAALMCVNLRVRCARVITGSPA